MNIYILFVILFVIVYVAVWINAQYRFNVRYNPLLTPRGMVIQGIENAPATDRHVLVLNKKTCQKGGYDLGKTESLNGRKRWSVNFWMKPENVTLNYHEGNDSQLEHILDWGKSVQIVYEPLRNELVIAVNVIVQKEKQETQEFRIPQCVKMQRWNMVTLSFNNRLLDVFVDGKLFKSIVFFNVPIYDEGRWRTCDVVGFSGKLTAMRFFYTSLEEFQVQSLYHTMAPTVSPVHPYFWWLWKPEYFPFTSSN